MERRQFLRCASEALLVLPFGTFLLSACGTDDSLLIGGSRNPTEPDPDAPEAPPRLEGDVIVYTSSSNDAHSHAFTMPAAALVTPPPQGIFGDTSQVALHSHTVAIPQDALRRAMEGEAVRVETGNTAGHTHLFTIVQVR